MMRFFDGSVRYFTVFEGKRIQTFPDDFKITGAWTEAMRQIGNAVPVMLGEKVGRSLFRQLNPSSAKSRRSSLDSANADLRTPRQVALPNPNYAPAR